MLWNGTMCQLTEAEAGIYASVKHTNIASDNGLAPMLLYCKFGTYVNVIHSKFESFHSREWSYKSIIISSFAYYFYLKQINKL